MLDYQLMTIVAPHEEKVKNRRAGFDKSTPYLFGGANFNLMNKKEELKRILGGIFEPNDSLNSSITPIYLTNISEFTLLSLPNRPKYQGVTFMGSKSVLMQEMDKDRIYLAYLEIWIER